MKKYMRYIVTIAALLMVSIGAQASGKVKLYGTPQNVTYAISTSEGGTYTPLTTAGIEHEKNTTVYLKVTPAEGFTIAKSAIKLQQAIGGTNAQTRSEGPEIVGTISLVGDDPTNLSSERIYTFTMPNDDNINVLISGDATAAAITSIYGTYDFRTWAMNDNHVKTKGKTVSIELSDGFMTGTFTGDDAGTDPTMTLNYAFSLTGENASEVTVRRNDTNTSGLLLNNNPVTFTINRLSEGDWFSIQYTGSLKFSGTNNVRKSGSSSNVEDGSDVEAGAIYVVKGDGNVNMSFGVKNTNSYIYSIQISNEDAVSAPVINVDGNNLVTINGGTSLKGNAVTVYYTTDNTDPTTSTTQQVYSAPFTPAATVKVRAYSVLASDETVVSAEAEPAVVRIGTWTGETNVFDFASAANNYVDITFGDVLDGIKMYGGGNSQNADANFYPITNTDWLTASTGNTAVIGWRDSGAKFDKGGLVQNGQGYFTIANLTEGQRIQIELVGRLRYRTGESETAPVVLNGGAAVTTDTYLGTKNAESTIALTIQSGSYMVFLCENSDVVIKKITVLDALPTYTLTVDYDNTKGSVTANNAVLSESYQEGTVVSLLATPDEDYQFVEWTDNEGTRLSLENPYEITITANTSLKAVFKQPTTPAVAIIEEKTWTFDGFTTGVKLSGTKVYEFDGLYISGHNSDESNQATVMAGEASTGIAGNVTKYVNIAGKNNSVTATIDPSTFTTDAIALKTGPGIVEFYDKGKGTNRYFNVFVNGTKYQTEMTQTESANDFQLIRQDAYAATNNVFFSTSDGGHQLYAVKFTPETVTAPTISADGTITNGTSNLIADANKLIKTYYTIDGTAPTTESTLSTGSVKTEGNFTVKAFSVNSVTGTQSEVVEQAVTVTLPSNLGTTIPVILVAGQSNTDGRVPVSDLPSDYTGLQNCYWSYCNAQKVYAGSGLSTSYTTEGNFQLYSPLNDGGGGWAYDAIVYNEIGKNLNEKFYVVKQSKGNTAISPAAGGCGLFWSANPLWLSCNESTNKGGQSLLKAFIGNIEASLAKIATGNPEKEADIKFLMWHQGECDGAGSQGVAYYTQLKALINYVRNYLAQKYNKKYSNLPIVLGGIPAVSDQYREEVENAKQQLANEDLNIYYVPADMITSKENDLLAESTTVHFNAKSAKAFGAAVWQVINDNHLLYGLQDGTGSATPVADILAETTKSATTKWDFSEETANTKYTAVTDKNGLYLIASSSKNMTVKEMSGITSVTYRDGETVTTSKALYTEMANRSNWTKYGLTAGDISAVDRSFGVNVTTAGTFYAIVAPNTEPTEAQDSRTIYLVVNGEKVDEVNALEAWKNTNHLAELKYKLDGPATIFLMGDHATNLYAAKFVKDGEETGAFQIKVTATGGTVSVTSPSGKTLDSYFNMNEQVTLKAEDTEGYTFEKWTGDVPSGANANNSEITLTMDADKSLTAVFRQKAVYDLTQMVADGASTLTYSSDVTTVYVSEEQSDGSRKDTQRKDFYAVTNLDSKVSVRTGVSGVTIANNAIRFTRPFAIHNLQEGDELILVYSGGGTLLNATPESTNPADKISMDNTQLPAGSEIESGSVIKITAISENNNYIVLAPNGKCLISAIYLNTDLPSNLASNLYVSPSGNDSNSGTSKSSPFKTLKRAQEKVQSKGTVHILPGTYKVTNAEYMDKTNTTWNVIYNLNTANVQYIGEVDSDGKRPVFDFSNVTAEDNKRITGFLLSAKNITIKNIETIGIQVPKISGDDTQSEFFRLNGASVCTLQNIAAHDGNGIGFYIHGKSRDNLVVDCDAYQNVDLINNTGENNDGFGCHVATGYTGNKFLRCRAWNNADDGFDLLKCQAVVTIEECIAYANGMASGIDIKGNGNGIKAGGFGKAAFSASLEIPMHVVKNCIAVRNRKSGFYANHHLGGLQFEGNRAFDNNPDFNMMNRSLESLTETIPENSDPRMEVDGYGHLLSNNIVYRNSDFDKLITYTNPSECTLVGNSFTYQNGEWTNKAYTEADFVSLAVSGLLKERDATGKLPDAVFDFMKLKDTGETVDAPTVELKSEEDGKATYSVTYPADAELHYKLPNDETEYTKTGGSTDIEVTSNGKLIAWAVKGNNSSTIVQISVLLTGAVVYDFANTTDNINADDNNKKRTLDYGETSASFRYVLNGSDRLRVLTYASTGKFTQGTGLWLDGSDRPFAIEGVKAGDMIRVIHNGTIIDANAEKTGTTIADINGNAFTGDIASGKAIMVKTADADNDYAVLMANSKNLTISMLAINHAIAPQIKKDTEQSGNGKYIYKVRFYEGETLHYTSPDADGEQTVNYGSDGIATITVTKDGKLSCWTTYGSTESEKVAATIDSSVETATIEVKAGYQTYYAEKTLDFSNMNTAELRAYIVMTTSTAASTRSATRGTSASQLELKEVSKVPAQTALVLWAKNASTIEVPYLETGISKIMLVSNTEVATSENLLKKAAKTEIAESDEVIFVPNTNGELNFDYSSFVSRGSIYIEIPASIIDENVKELTLGKTQEDGTVVPMEVTIATLKNVTPVLDTENSNKSKKVYIFNFSSGQKLYYKRAGQDTEFRNASWTEGGTSISNSNNGFMEYYIQEGNTTSRTDAKVVMLVPKATLAKIGSNTSTYQVDFFDGATLYYTLGDEAEQSVNTGSPFEISVTKGTKFGAYSKTSTETTESLSTSLYAPTPAIANDSVYQFADIKDEIGIDYVLNSVGFEDEAIELDGISLKVPNALTSQTLDRFAFSAPRADGKGETSDWRLLNAGRLRATKSEVDKHLLIQGAKKGNMLLLTYSGATISYVEASSTAKLPENTSTITSNQKYEVQNDGDLLLKIPADTENNCDITVISLSSKYNTSSGEGSGSSSSTTTKASVPAIDFYRLENDTVAIYRISWDQNSELHYILQSEETEQSGGTSGTYDLPISKDDVIQAWATTASDTSKVVKATLFAPTPAPGINGNIDFSEASEDLIADMPLALDMNRKVTVGGETLYFPTELTRNTFNDKFAFSEFSGNKVRIRRNRTLTFAKGDDVKMGILDLKKGDIVAFDFTGKVQIVNSSAVKMETTKSQTRAASTESMASGEAYIMQHDGNLLLNMALKDTTVVINKMYIAPAPSKSEAAAIDFISAAEDYEDLDFGHSTSVYYYAKANAQSFKMLANDSHELPINNKVSTEGGNGTLTTNGMTAGNRRLAIHNLAVGDEIMLRITSGSVTFEGHEQKGNIITVNGKQLMPQDTLRSGDIIKVEKVNYLYNYVVLKLDSKASVSGIYINAEDEEKVTMPTIVDKGSNTVLITAGQSTTGNQVTTCYTTDGSEPTSMNGTSGPYDEIELHLLGGGMVTIKAVSYTDRGIYSKVACITIYADDLVGSGKAASRSVTGTYDMQGNKVSSVQRGGVYIRDGKKVFFGK